MRQLFADDHGLVLGGSRALLSEIREVTEIFEARNGPENALQLQIHIKTVESHRMELMRRFGIHDVAGLVRYPIRHGLALVE